MGTRPLKIRYVLHGYPPFHNAGAETMAHNINLWLAHRGHDVQVLARPAYAVGDWQGIKVKPRGPDRWLERQLAGAVTLTHLDETPIVEAATARNNYPLAHVLHNDKQLDYHAVRHASLLVANTAWIADTIPDRFDTVPRTVLHPPTFLETYDTDPSERVAYTLVNLTDGKGGPLFYELARRLSDRPFLAVTGAYGDQRKPPRDLDNVTVRPNRPAMAPVWRKTLVYLCPSVYESYGKAAVEALASGIPVIAHPTPGLLESLGDAGIFADRDDPDAWVREIRRLDSPIGYARAAKAARARAAELEARTFDQLENLEAHLEAIAP